ncbi:mechanosensitive ion channel protein 1, mitochondrial-like isoform X1 [Oryza brachyantha]|nr:mechanosensitive ion channel protein 1, mitochondrial-like isoform X1 [Oryza brachyantha]
MPMIAATLRRASRATVSQNIMEICVGPCISSDASLRWFSSCTKHTNTSILNHIKVMDRYSPVNGVSMISRMPSSAHMDTSWSTTSKPRFNALAGFLGASSICRAYSSDTGIKAEVPHNTVSNVSSAETVELGTPGGGSSWFDILENARTSTLEATTDAGKKVKDLTDAITPHVQQLFDANPNLEKVVVPLGGTILGTVMAWFVMPVMLRRIHKYASQNPISVLLGNSTKNDVSYETSLWSALEDPAKYLITFMAFSEMAGFTSPSISAYLPQAWRGAIVLSFVWFLHRWKTNFITKSAASSIDQARLSAFDKVSSLGLIALGIMALAEACGVAPQSILTVGGVGGVATAFAARDVLGNMLSGFSLQFSSPFKAGEYIKAGSIEGRVVKIGLTSTELINPEQLPVTVPNSLFSSQVIVNKSRAERRASVTKIPIRIEDVEKVPAISEEIKVMLRSNPKVVSDSETQAPYCYLSRLESSYGELTIGCNLKKMKKDEWLSTTQDILLEAAKIIKLHGVELGSTTQCC